MKQFPGTSGKEDNLTRNAQIFETFLPEISILFDFCSQNLLLNDTFAKFIFWDLESFVPFIPALKVPQFLVQWKVPTIFFLHSRQHPESFHVKFK